MSQLCVIRYSKPMGGAVYVRVEDYDAQYGGRTWPTDIALATRFHNATQAAQYMMKMGPCASEMGSPRCISSYDIVSIVITPPVPVREVVRAGVTL